MNRYLSILQLNIKRSLWKVLLLAAVFAAGELGWFAWRLSADPQMSLFRAGRVFGTCFVICLVLSAVLLGFQSSKGSRPEYSLRMFAVGSSARYIISLLYDLAAMVFVWAAQALVLLAAIRIYMSKAGYTGGPQGALVEICSSPALGTIMPLEYKEYWALVIVCVAALAFAASYMKKVRLLGKFPVISSLIIILAGSSLYSMTADRMYKAPWTRAGFAAFMAVLSLYMALAVNKDDKKEDDYE